MSKIKDFTNIEIQGLENRLKTLMEYNRIVKKKINNVESYLVNQKLTDSQPADLFQQLPNISLDPSIPDTPICINGLKKDSAPDHSFATPIIDTPIYNHQSHECLTSPYYAMSQPFILKSLNLRPLKSFELTKYAL